MAHEHSHSHVNGRDAERGALKAALALIVVFMIAEVTAGVIANSLALLSDAAHMLTDAVALAVALIAARLAARPAGGAMTYGLGRAEILSAQANGLTLLVLSVLIVVDAISRLISPPDVHGGLMLVVAIVGRRRQPRRGADPGARLRARPKPQRRGLLPSHPHRPVRLHRDRGRRDRDPDDRL